MKKKVVLLYGEKTVQVNYRVPESKKDEVNEKIRNILKVYESPKIIEIEVVSKRVRNIQVIDPEIVNSTKFKPVVLQESWKKYPGEIFVGESQKKSTAKQSNDSTKCGPEELPEYRVIESIPTKAIEVKKGVSNLRELDGKWFTQIYAGGKFEYREYYDLTKAKLYIANNFKK